MRYRPLPIGRYPEALARAEQDLVARRRAAAQLRGGARLGLALSGGGIRSATFSLGLVQAMARLGLLKEVDFLSTVSGGGYLGAFLGGLFCPRGEEAPGAREVEQGLVGEGPAAAAVGRSLGWLRENGRYLTPGGSGDAFMAAATVLRNGVAVQIVLALVILLGMLLLDGIGGVLPWLEMHGLLHLAGAPMVLSPWLYLGPLFFLALGGVVGWAYWMVPQAEVAGRKGMLRRPWIASVLFVAGLALALGLGWTADAPPWLTQAGWAVVGLGIAALLVCLLRLRRPPAEARRSLDHGMRLALLLAVVFLGVGVVDGLAWTLHQAWFPPRAPGQWAGVVPGALGALGALLAFKDRLAGFLGAPAAARWGKRLAQLAGKAALTLAALAVGLLVLGMLGALAHRLAFGAIPLRVGEAVPLADPGAYALGVLLLLALNVLVGRTFGFLNLSTLGPFYTSALTRAYVGASNRPRREGDASPDLRPSDDLAWADYRPWEGGGPLHLVNTTLNETVGGRSQVVQKDRRGLILVTGPAALTLGIRHHALAEAHDPGPDRVAGFHAFGPAAEGLTPEALTLGQWMGISGAAFTTGLGSRTRLAFSLFLGLLNVRLGHWWWSGIAPTSRPVSFPRVDRLRLALEWALPVQVHLLEECTARFPGSASRHWYLSDGGHYENTAAHELLRRRLPLIVLSDNGQDPGRGMTDLANLVSKARVDLDADIRFLQGEELKALVGDVDTVGGIAQLVDPAAPSVAALAEVRYHRPEAVGYLLLVKPTLTPDLPMDLRGYAAANPEFPQQTTADQFFDEAQWEAYRALGERVGLLALGGSAQAVAPSAWIASRL